MLAALLGDLFAIKPLNLKINHDRYSLNSLNGFFDTQGEDGSGGAFFFKFHQEEGEEAMAGEYYRADILARAGLPVDQPVHMSAEPGEQILVYRRRDEPRFSDILRALDLSDDAAGRGSAVAAEKDLGAALLATYLATLHPITPAEAAAEPIHRLFHERLIERVGEGLPPRYPAGRYGEFYVGKPFAFPGVTLDWNDLSTRRFTVNAITYASTLGQIFDAAEARLRPERLADAGGVVAHGDAHNANVWFSQGSDGARLSFFDPAFAGAGVPTLLAEVKTTFHNIFAHPFWLYDPDLASTRFTAKARLEPGHIVVESDWEITPVRAALLDVKADGIWRPLLAELKARGMLPADWRAVIRLALFLCPTLVMNLRAGARTHTPLSSLIAFSVAVMVGSEPVTGEDVVTRFLDRIDPDGPQ
ncbi:phosphotransferase [Ancylobacter pratisalsi]|uniref:phosphotransferase n=1 Tax=Ancylobacter pratisalsi TaxID=1745854 RepID=UPI003CCE3DE0